MYERRAPDGSPGYFIWLRTMIGPQCQWWSELYYGERDRLRPYVLVSIELRDDEVSMSLNELTQRYPLPERYRGFIDE